MDNPSKPILDYASGKPTAAQRRKRWLMIGGLTGGSIAAAAVSLVLAQPKATTAPMILGEMVAPVPATQPATQPAALPGKVRAPSVQTDSHA